MTVTRLPDLWPLTGPTSTDPRPPAEREPRPTGALGVVLLGALACAVLAALAVVNAPPASGAAPDTGPPADAAPVRAAVTAAPDGDQLDVSGPVASVVAPDPTGPRAVPMPPGTALFDAPGRGLIPPHVTDPPVQPAEGDPDFDCRAHRNRLCGVQVQGEWYVLDFATGTFGPRP